MKINIIKLEPESVIKFEIQAWPLLESPVAGFDCNTTTPGRVFS